MDYVEVKEWLDKLIDSINERFSLVSLNNNIRTVSSDNNVHMFEGIEIIADILGEELKEKFDPHMEYPYRYFFVYKGIEIFQLSQKPLTGGKENE